MGLCSGMYGQTQNNNLLNNRDTSEGAGGLKYMQDLLRATWHLPEQPPTIPARFLGKQVLTHDDTVALISIGEARAKWWQKAYLVHSGGMYDYSMCGCTGSSDFPDMVLMDN